MIEAQIICSAPCDIPDLGIIGLKRGEERWISVTIAESSKDLLKQQRKGNVRVYRKVRRMEKAPKRPPPPFVARSRPAVPEKAEPVEPQVVERIVERVEVVNQEVDTEKLKAELLGDLLPGLRAVVAEEMARSMATHKPSEAPQAVPAPSPGIDPAQLESVLESVVRRVMPAGGSAGPTRGSAKAAGPTDPLFIPTDVVKKDAKAKIEVKSKQTEGTGDLDDAQAALRAMKRKKRGRKNESEETDS